MLLAVLLVPLFVNANTFRSTLETQLSSALGRKVTLGNLSFSVFSGSLVADNISIADDPAFSAKPFLQAQSLHIGVEVGPLLFHRQLLVTSFVADSPSINLVHNAQGVWNFSNIGSTAASRTQNPEKETALPNFTVGEMKVVNGTAVVSDLPSTGPPFTYSNLNLSVQQFSFAKSFPFVLTASLPGGGLLDVKWQRRSGKPKGRLRDATGCKHQLEALRSGGRRRSCRRARVFSMLADITAQVTSNGQTLTSNGTVHAQPICSWWPTALPLRSPVDITYTVNHNLTGQNRPGH